MQGVSKKQSCLFVNTFVYPDGKHRGLFSRFTIRGILSVDAESDPATAGSPNVPKAIGNDGDI